ncbi:MAG: hypothetical protein ACLQDM_04890 [Bradyrhizobium sp.]
MFHLNKSLSMSWRATFLPLLAGAFIAVSLLRSISWTASFLGLLAGVLIAVSLLRRSRRSGSKRDYYATVTSLLVGSVLGYFSYTISTRYGISLP